MSDQTLFDTVLVANRGEIARRVIRTLRRLGIRSIAVYSDADVNAPHVHEADEAVHIGGSAASASYLNIPAVLDAARQTGADAIHPGYGFLSENAAFGAACAEAGIVFIGPDARALEVMGDKIRARDHVSGYGVPIVPGFSAAGMTDAEIGERAEETGYPLLIKPSAGGGGKGMEVVRSAAELPGALATARRVARASFGDDTLLLERLIERPRHIEVQVLGDGRGGAVHLGERECTLQRRHQKVIEESPSPVVDAQTRERLGAAACAAAASVDYRGAGTVEFIVATARPDEFFFIEMNTRLQVEHPVTEAVTGVDLVEQQLRIAAGLGADVPPGPVQLRGHAVEARVYAEDPARGFLPATGRVLQWDEAAGARTDSAVEHGSVITADYDPMVAKVIAHAEDRAGALAALDAALAETVLLGVDTNIAFLRELLAQPDVQAGTMDTGLIDRMPPFATPEPGEESLRRAAQVVALTARRWGSHETAGVWQSLPGWRSAAPAATTPVFLQDAGGHIHSVAAEGLQEPSEPAAEAEEAEYAWFAMPPDGVWMEMDDDTGTIWIHAEGLTSSFRVLTRRRAGELRRASLAKDAAASDPDLPAPMPGAVVAVHVTDGQAVAAGDRILSIEAMKMEHPITAPHEGTVRLHVSVGDQVQRDQVVAVVSISDPSSAPEGA
ncbi:acetyl-COA carboxylase [Microbacterium mangrovi]|uniref:biotin carboxylase n=1 Tax=Microbacterium mangrovi TaxID=1348253 RepID=A0A0B2A139_9MICO|nr:biotin carboxylase N-terminal domain-containing protein [Microbacterium mangrovi]KHK95300.1 acetyl-COA carboxylase [Microbacterium mangrovi]